MSARNFELLSAHILTLSVSPIWASAREEWTLASIYISETHEQCPCSQYPIYEICTIRNMRNGNETDVGNVCVKQFVGIDSSSVFDCIKRIRQDIRRPLGSSAIAFFYEEGMITDWEANFLTDTLRKRNLSAKQAAVREKLNRKILVAAAN
jgi:hypothetical protein